MDKQQLIITGGAALAGVGLGFGVGYILAKKKFAAYAEEEIEAVKEAYRKNAMPKPDLDLIQNNYAPNTEAFREDVQREIENQKRLTLDPSIANTPLIAVKEPESVEQVMRDAGYSQVATETDAERFEREHGRPPTTYELVQMGGDVDYTTRNPADHDDDNVKEVNLFDDPPAFVDEELGGGVDEIPGRSPERPYIISNQEWFLNETNYSQITLTYYADDDILADDANRQVNDINDVVGATNLHRFGVQSESPDLVYVRNERLQADYEITKDERAFAVVVHGIDPDEYAERDTPRRMRRDDDV